MYILLAVIGIAVVILIVYIIVTLVRGAIHDIIETWPAILLVPMIASVVIGALLWFWNRAIGNAMVIIGLVSLAFYFFHPWRRGP